MRLNRKSKQWEAKRQKPSIAQIKAAVNNKPLIISENHIEPLEELTEKEKTDLAALF